jgi:hypothetical protein
MDLLCMDEEVFNLMSKRPELGIQEHLEVSLEELRVAGVAAALQLLHVFSPQLLQLPEDVAPSKLVEIARGLEEGVAGRVVKLAGMVDLPEVQEGMLAVQNDRDAPLRKLKGLFVEADAVAAVKAEVAAQNRLFSSRSSSSSDRSNLLLKGLLGDGDSSSSSGGAGYRREEEVLSGAGKQIRELLLQRRHSEDIRAHGKFQLQIMDGDMVRAELTCCLGDGRCGIIGALLSVVENSRMTFNDMQQWNRGLAEQDKKWSLCWGPEESGKLDPDTSRLRWVLNQI